jgi:hypothetical protein
MASGRETKMSHSTFELRHSFYESPPLVKIVVPVFGPWSTPSFYPSAGDTLPKWVASRR